MQLLEQRHQQEREEQLQKEQHKEAKRCEAAAQRIVEQIIRVFETASAQSHDSHGIRSGVTRGCLWHANQEDRFVCSGWRQHPPLAQTLLVVRMAQERLNAKLLGFLEFGMPAVHLSVDAANAANAPVKIAYVVERTCTQFLIADNQIDAIAQQLADAARAMDRPGAIATHALACANGDAAAALVSTLDALAKLSGARVRAQEAFAAAETAFERARAAYEEATVALEERVADAEDEAEAKAKPKAEEPSSECVTVSASAQSCSTEVATALSTLGETVEHEKDA
jgi:hypothetical protein